MRGAWSVFVVVVLGATCASRRETRTDLAPLTSRLKLPAAGLSDARWVSVPEHEAGCDWLPEPDRAYRLYASVTLDPADWATVAPQPGATATLALPADIARAMLPTALLMNARVDVTLSGTEVPSAALSRSEHVHVTHALRVGSTLVLELYLPRS